MSGLFKFGPGVKWPGVSKTLEEMGELAQQLGKLIMVDGQDEKHWSGPLRPRIVEESADVAAALHFNYRHNMTPLEQSQYDIRVAAKLAKFEEWHEEGETLLCDHDWQYTGYDRGGSHKGEDCYRCRKCGETEYRP